MSCTRTIERCVLSCTADVLHRCGIYHRSASRVADSAFKRTRFADTAYTLAVFDAVPFPVALSGKTVAAHVGGHIFGDVKQLVLLYSGCRAASEPAAARCCFLWSENQMHEEKYENH